MIRFESAAATHVGQVRDVNQDRALVTGNLIAVADGMGGHAGGERAAALAVSELEAGAGQTLTHEELLDVVDRANRRIYDEAEAPELRGMGTTLVAAVVDVGADVVHVANVGDSRAYLLRDDELLQITNDHSLVEDLVRQGRLSPDDAKVHPQRNIVTRVLGISGDVDIDSFAVDVEPGDRLVLCSDGLVNEVDDDAITTTLGRFAASGDAADELVALALDRGGRDNITVAVIDVFEPDPAATSAETPSTAAIEGDTVDIAFESDDPVISPKKKRRLPFRSLFLSIAVLAVGLAGFVGTAWYARSAWYAEEIGGEVVIFRGRPDGILWFQPTQAERTGVRVADLDPASRELLASRPDWGSIDDARAFVENLESNSTGSDSTGSDSTGSDSTGSDSTGSDSTAATGG